MGMHARVMRVELGDVDRGIAYVRDRVVPSARRQPGIVAAYWLLDRASGHGLAVTIWDSEDAMVAADAVAREAARTEKQEGAVEAAALELYEVIAHL
jgi:heme-degrading monooxygenase HmoA